jgi:NAD(P)-dependent dehydrogenase (short-subunit alcohol dehydrogenase family)
MEDLRGKVAVVTGGAAGIGRGLAEALLEAGARVVLADVEAAVLEETALQLGTSGDVVAVRTDVSDFDSVSALADAVYDRFGACHLLFNNAGVTSGGGGLPWEQEANDWRWCFSVNVFGVANGVMAFVPRMLAGGQPGVIVNTSSGDGGIAPVPYASVYASSKAAVSCLTEAVAHQLAAAGGTLRACVFYPSGGLLETGLWTAPRNRPPELARRHQRAAAPGTTFAEFKAQLAAAGRSVETVDLLELGRFVLDRIRAGDYVIAHDLDETGKLLHHRADAIARGELPAPML